MPQQSGLNVQVELPHTVYLGQKLALAKDDVQVTKAEFLPGSHQVQIDIRNIGDRLGRVSGIEVRGEREKATHPGFPLMPRSQRKITVDWKLGTPPQRAVVEFKNFKVETPLQERRN